MKQSTNNQQKRKCEGLSFWERLSFSLSLRLRSLIASLSSWKNRIISVLASRVVTALAALKKSSSNNRTYAGLLLICCAGPLSGVAYLSFDQTVSDPSWYYDDYFWLFYVLGPHIQVVLTVTGAFLLFPRENKTAYFLLVPIGYHIAQIIWFIQVNSDEEIKGSMPYAFWMLGGLAGYAWVRLFDHLMSLHYHKRTQPIATAKGIIKMQGMSADDKLPLLEHQLSTLETVMK